MNEPDKRNDKPRLAGQDAPPPAAEPNPVDEAYGKEARVMLKSIRLPATGPIPDNLKHEIRETVRAHIKQYTLTYRAIGAQIDAADSTVSETLSGKYRGDTDAILRRLNAWVDDDEKRRRRIKPLGIADFDFRDKEHCKQFRDTYGRRILDFGAGRAQEVGWIKQRLGIDALPFEPFQRRGGKLSIARTRQLADALFRRLTRGWRPDTVFCNFVLSSIGSADDRQHVLTLLAALGRHARQVVIAVRSLDDVSYLQVLGRVKTRKGGYLGIPDSAEPGLIVTSAGTATQKFQKFYGEDEFRSVLAAHFQDIRRASLEVRDTALVMVCRRPHRPGKAQLQAALQFEFDLPINGKPLARSEQAAKAFAAYLRPRTTRNKESKA